MPATNWKEQIAPDEIAHFEALAEQLHVLQRKHSSGARALHAKGVAGVEAEFHVSPDVPDFARIGLFEKPASYRAYVRFSNGSGKRQHDRKADARGMALKIVGVAGQKIIPGMESAPTQDFLGNHSPTVPFVDAAEFVFFVCAAERPALLLFRLIGRFGFARTFRLLKALARTASIKVSSVATTRYFSASPIAFGPYAAQYRFEPRTTTDAGAGSAADFAEELGPRLARGAIEYDLRAQFFANEASTPIESSMIAWSESDAPPITLGRVVIPAQDIMSPRGKKIAAFVEKLSFDPWHALTVFRPLGNLMRARNHAYRVSVIERNAAPEPDGSERFD